MGASDKDKMNKLESEPPVQKPREEDEFEEVDQDPGHRQKENQGDEKDDPLAA